MLSEEMIHGEDEDRSLVDNVAVDDSDGGGDGDDVEDEEEEEGGTGFNCFFLNSQFWTFSLSLNSSFLCAMCFNLCLVFLVYFIRYY